MHGGDRLGMRAPLVRRRAGNDVPDPGDARGHDRHMGRRDHRIAPARHVAADAVDRNVAMAEHDAGQRFDLDILHRITLDLREVADLRLREFDVGDRLCRHSGEERADLLRRQAKARGRPFVEALGKFADRLVAALPDIGEDRFDRRLDLGVRLFLLARQRGRLDVARHPILLKKTTHRRGRGGCAEGAMAMRSTPAIAKPLRPLR